MMLQIMLYISAVLALIGSIGLFRFPDFYTRAHAANIITIGGVCLALSALFISLLWSVYSLKIVLIILFILLTSPASTHAIANKMYEAGFKPKGLVKNEMGEKK